MIIFITVSVKMYVNVIPICIWCAGMEIPTFVRNIELNDTFYSTSFVQRGVLDLRYTNTPLWATNTPLWA